MLIILSVGLIISSLMILIINLSKNKYIRLCEKLYEKEKNRPVVKSGWTIRNGEKLNKKSNKKR